MNSIIELEDGKLEVVEEVKKTIFKIESEIKKLQELQNKYKQALIEEIEKRGFTKCSISNDLFTLSYKAPSTRESLDNKKLKEDMPEIYDEYVRLTNVKSSITIKVK